MHFVSPRSVKMCFRWLPPYIMIEYFEIFRDEECHFRVSKLKIELRQKW